MDVRPKTSTRKAPRQKAPMLRSSVLMNSDHDPGGTCPIQSNSNQDGTIVETTAAKIKFSTGSIGHDSDSSSQSDEESARKLQRDILWKHKLKVDARRRRHQLHNNTNHAEYISHTESLTPQSRVTSKHSHMGKEKTKSSPGVHNNTTTNISIYRETNDCEFDRKIERSGSVSRATSTDDIEQDHFYDDGDVEMVTDSTQTEDIVNTLSELYLQTAVCDVLAEPVTNTGGDKSCDIHTGEEYFQGPRPQSEVHPILPQGHYKIEDSTTSLENNEVHAMINADDTAQIADYTKSEYDGPDTIGLEQCNHLAEINYDLTGNVSSDIVLTPTLNTDNEKDNLNAENDVDDKQNMPDDTTIGTCSSNILTADNLNHLNTTATSELDITSESALTYKTAKTSLEEPLDSNKKEKLEDEETDSSSLSDEMLCNSQSTVKYVDISDSTETLTQKLITSGEKEIKEVKNDGPKSTVNSYDEKLSTMRKSRINPFNKEVYVEENHFEAVRTTRALTADSFQSNSSYDSHSVVSDLSSGFPRRDSEDFAITDADLGLAEDHFSRPEGHFGMTSSEEVEMAIGTCKAMILSATPHTDKHKDLVSKLVKLRLKLADSKEKSESSEESLTTKATSILGHSFRLRTSRSSKHYCEKCCGVIWSVVQTWYKCTLCGFCAHAKCINLVTRTCAGTKIFENPTYILEICPEKGLSAQKYRCAECRSQISFKVHAPRQCDYSGKFYCENCHWNDSMVMPARVMHNWDFELKKVCRASRQFLKLMANRSSLRIQDINPMLFNYVEELNEVKKLREEILIMKKYFLSCPAALESKLLLQLQQRQHFVENSDMYSLQDLIDTASDSLVPSLTKIHASFAQHIKTDCTKCQSKGFICELCDDHEILFPFDNIAIVCSRCSTVLHRHCFEKVHRKCPKCFRINK